MKYVCVCFVIVVVLILVVLFVVSVQENELLYSWNVIVVFDYLFCGVLQIDEKLILQVGFIYILLVGLYVGVWGLGVDFGLGDLSIEVDYQIGYGVDVMFCVNFDVLLNCYIYFGVSELNYNELIIIIMLDEIYKLMVVYINDVWNSSIDGWYFGLGGSWGLLKDFILNVNVGCSIFEDGIVKDYIDWNVGVECQFGLFNVGLGYYGIDGNGCDNLGKLVYSCVLLIVVVGK